MHALTDGKKYMPYLFPPFNANFIKAGYEPLWVGIHHLVSCLREKLKFDFQDALHG